MSCTWESFRIIAGWNYRNAAFSRLEARGDFIYAIDLHLNSPLKFKGDLRGQKCHSSACQGWSTLALSDCWTSSPQWFLPCSHLWLLEPHKISWESRQGQPIMQPIFSVVLVLVQLASHLEPHSTQSLHNSAPFGWPPGSWLVPLWGPFCFTQFHFGCTQGNVLLTQAPEPDLQRQEDSALGLKWGPHVKAWVRLPGGFWKALRVPKLRAMLVRLGWVWISPWAKFLQLREIRVSGGCTTFFLAEEY